MREIMFRLIRDGKIVGYEKHIYEHASSGGCHIFHSEGAWQVTWVNIRYFPEKYIDHDSKDQYAGLKDKNGTEIYEGDIINHLITSTPQDCFGVKRVIFSEGMFKMLRENKTASPLGWPSPLCLEVIGNIYETPELLEASHD